jgi:outer membrane murein-binding lipoprotein Lpp
MNSAKLKKMNKVVREVGLVEALDSETKVLMAGLREALAVIQKLNTKIATLESDVKFLEGEYKSAQYLLAENRKANRARIRASQHKD